MFSLHIISDLDLGFNEFTPKSEENLPDVDLIVLNGNIGLHPKRGMLYAEQMSKKYLTTQFVYNYGFHEYIPKGGLSKNMNEAVASVTARQNFNDTWPSNLHVFLEQSKQIKLRTGEVLDIYCSFGYPKILSYTGNWEDTIWHKYLVCDYSADINDKRLNLPAETSKVNHGMLPIWATQEWINQQNEAAFNSIKKWEITYDATSGYKILITHINPLQDNRLTDQQLSFYDIHLDNRLWITANTKIEKTKYLGAKLLSNPGRGTEVRSFVEKIIL